MESKKKTKKEVAIEHGTIYGCAPGKKNRSLFGQGAYEPNAMIPVISPHQNPEKFGTRLVKDEKTGYLEMQQSQRNPVYHFTVEKKIKFIELADKYWPNIFRVCNEVGVHYATYKNHLILDEQFSMDMDLVKQQKVDIVESNVFEFSKRPANFMDRMAILRAYRGDLYNPVNKIQNVTPTISKDDAVARKLNLATVVDAEVVKASAEILETKVENKKEQEIESATNLKQELKSENEKDPLLNILEE